MNEHTPKETSHLTQEIIIRTNNQHVFSIIATPRSNGNLTFDAQIISPTLSHPFQWDWPENDNPINEAECFFKAMKLAIDYTEENGGGSVEDVHNPCNTPFISEAVQNSALQLLGLKLSVRVN